MWVEDCLIYKAKTVLEGRTKWRIPSLVPISRKMFSHFQKSRTSPHVRIIWKDKHYDCEYSPLFFSCTSALCLNLIRYGVEYLFGQLGSTVLTVFPANLLCTPFLFACRAMWEAEKNLTLNKYCSSTAWTLVCYQQLFMADLKYSTIWITMKKVNSISAKKQYK